MFDDFLPKARRFNPELKVAGILVTKFAGRAEERRVVGELVSAYGDLVLDPPVPRHEIVATAFESLHLPLRQMHDLRDQGRRLLRGPPAADPRCRRYGADQAPEAAAAMTSCVVRESSGQPAAAAHHEPEEAI